MDFTPELHRQQVCTHIDHHPYWLIGICYLFSFLNTNESVLQTAGSVSWWIWTSSVMHPKTYQTSWITAVPLSKAWPSLQTFFVVKCVSPQCQGKPFIHEGWLPKLFWRLGETERFLNWKKWSEHEMLHYFHQDSQCSVSQWEVLNFSSFLNRMLILINSRNVILIVQLWNVLSFCGTNNIPYVTICPRTKLLQHKELWTLTRASTAQSYSTQLLENKMLILFDANVFYVMFIFRLRKAICIQHKQISPAKFILL